MTLTQFWGFLSPGIENFFKTGDFYPRGLGIFSKLGIFISGDWGFFQNWGFLSPGFGVKLGFFRGWRFFILDGISHQKATSGH